MYELAKKSREDMKSKARRLAGEKDQKVDSSDWSPAPPLNADIKTGARPIMRPSSKGVGESIAAADTKAAIGNPKRGAYKSGGAVKDAGIKDKKALGAIDPSPKRAATPKPYKKGGKVKAKGKKIAKKKGGAITGLTVVIADKRASAPQTPALPGGPMMRGVPMPPPAPIGAMGAPGPGPMMPPGAVGAAPPAQLPMGRKSGGRITKVASSYKDMEAGAVSGEGRLQKTDIAKLHKGAPARKDGGRISKVAKSYKDMTAGAGDGEGRLQKTDIAKAKKVRAA